MRRRSIALLVLTVATLPLGALGQDREWEEDYTGQGDYGPPPGGDYDVSVDLSDQGSVSFDTFYGALSPYGEWVEVGAYGRCWRPHVAAGWRPYYYGRWEWTNEGWLWVSDEPWGWGPYHYGRWTWDGGLGWLWIPGYQWAPAWVSWRYSGDVVGWAPLGPGLSVYISSYPFVDYWWTFVPTARFVAVPVYSVAYAPRYARQYFYATSPAPPRPVPSRPAPGARPAPAWGGPAPRVIEQRIGRPVTPVRIVPSPSPGAGRVRPGEVSIYRPERPSPGRGPGAVPAPGRSGGAVQAPGRGQGGFAPGREAPGRGQGGFAPGREAPSRGQGGVAPGREAPDRGQGGFAPGRDPPGRRGSEGRPAPAQPGARDQGWAPPRQDGGRGAPAPRGEYVPRGDAREGYGSRAAVGGGYAPRGEGGGWAQRGGGYAPAPRGFAGGGGGAVAPRAERGGGGPAPASRGGGGGGRAHPGRGEGR